MVMVNDGANERYALYSAFEPAGMGITYFDNETQAASFTIFLSVGTVSHMFSFDDHQSLLVTNAGSNNVSALGYDPNDDAWVQRAFWYDFNFPGAGGNLVFATTYGENLGTFFVTDGTPAKVWSTPDWNTNNAATHLANAGTAPRGMVQEGNIIAVVNNGSLDMHTFMVSDIGAIVAGDTLFAGPGLTADSRTLPNGNIEVAVPTSNEEIIFIEVDSSNGREVSRLTLDVSSDVPGISDFEYIDDEWGVAASTQLNILVPIPLN
jgi:hypothetical protein